MQVPGVPHASAMSPDAAGPAVETVDLVKRYGSIRALNGLTVSFKAGAVTTVVGRNGAGKTTALEICQGLRTPDSGTVRVLGLDPTSDATQLRARVGVMAQEGLGLAPATRVGALLAHTAALYQHPHAVSDVLRWLSLPDVVNQQVRRLSGGQRQRVAFGLAIIGRPELVFLDEPTTGLDPHSRNEVWHIISQLRADGVTVVLTTHSMQEATELADDVVIVDAGTVLAQGTVQALTGGEPQARFSARTGLDLTALRSALATDVTIRETQPGRYVVDGGIDVTTLTALTAWCAGHGVSPTNLRIESRSLEDVFLELTGVPLQVP